MQTLAFYLLRSLGFHSHNRIRVCMHLYDLKNFGRFNSFQIKGQMSEDQGEFFVFLVLCFIGSPISLDNIPL
jgi:hypothetical protein